MNMYNELVAWIDEALAQGIPEDAVAVCFNVYEDGESSWSMELVACSSFDPDDDDLYQKNAPMNSFIKANLEQLREDAEANIRNTQEGFKRNVDEALSQINDLLKKTLNEQMRNCTQDQQEKLKDRLDKVIGLL